MVLAFGVPRFLEGKQKPAPVCIQEMNTRKEQLGLTDDDIISVQVDEEFYHVFYKKTAE